MVSLWQISQHLTFVLGKTVHGFFEPTWPLCWPVQPAHSYSSLSQSYMAAFPKANPKPQWPLHRPAYYKRFRSLSQSFSTLSQRLWCVCHQAIYAFPFLWHGPGEEQVHQNTIFWCNLEGKPGGRHTHWHRWCQSTYLSNKVFCFKAPLGPGIQMFAPPNHVNEGVVLSNYVKALSVLFQRPLVEPIIFPQKFTC